MIKQITDSNIFLEICDKLKEVKDCRLKENKLYTYMIDGIYNKKTFSFASYNDEGKMNGCEIITLNNDLNGDLTLFIIFLWLSPYYHKLWKQYMKFTEKKAKDFKVKRISFTTARSEKAIDRHLGKYGYKKIYNVIEKEIKEVI